MWQEAAGMTGASNTIIFCGSEVMPDKDSVCKTYMSLSCADPDIIELAKKSKSEEAVAAAVAIVLTGAQHWLRCFMLLAHCFARGRACDRRSIHDCT